MVTLPARNTPRPSILVFSTLHINRFPYKLAPNVPNDMLSILSFFL